MTTTQINIQDIETRYPDIIKDDFDPELFVHELDELNKVVPGFHTILLEAAHEGEIQGNDIRQCGYGQIKRDYESASDLCEQVCDTLEEQYGYDSRLTPLEHLLFYVDRRMTPADSPRLALLEEFLTTLFPLHGKIHEEEKAS